MSKNSILIIKFILLFSSCSVTKCRYSRGYIIDWNTTSNEKTVEQKAKKAEKKQMLSFVKDTATVKHVALVENDFVQKNIINDYIHTNHETINTKVAKGIFKCNENFRITNVNIKEKNNSKSIIRGNIKFDKLFWSDFFAFLFLFFLIICCLGIIASIIFIFTYPSLFLYVFIGAVICGLLSILSIYLSFHIGGGFQGIGGPG